MFIKTVLANTELEYIEVATLYIVNDTSPFQSVFHDESYNNNNAKKDPIKAVNPIAIIPASELLPLGATYSVSIQGHYNTDHSKR